jgi:hypothetical protein
LKIKIITKREGRKEEGREQGREAEGGEGGPANPAFERWAIDQC